MKPLLFFKIALSALLITGMNACSKSNDNPQTATPPPPATPGNTGPSFQVEYQITPLNDNISRIAYNDEQGNTIASYDHSGFSGGAKMIMVSKSSYTARISVVINNMSGGDQEYHLIIMINGKEKRNVKIVVPPMTFNNFASADYTLEYD
jgi:hypothetical protein